MKRKVYVMDCGDFVKIGVSGNVEQMATQIPYKVNQIFSTNEIENAFKLEHEMHMMFCEDRVLEAQGREYFNVPFDIAVSELKQKVNDINTSDKEKSNDSKYKYLIKMLSMLEYLDEFTLGYVFGCAMARKERGEGNPNMLTDTIKKFCNLPEDKQKNVLWYVRGVTDTFEAKERDE